MTALGPFPHARTPNNRADIVLTQGEWIGARPQWDLLSDLPSRMSSDPCWRWGGALLRTGPPFRAIGDVFLDHVVLCSKRQCGRPMWCSKDTPNKVSASGTTTSLTLSKDRCDDYARWSPKGPRGNAVRVLRQIGRASCREGE